MTDDKIKVKREKEKVKREKDLPESVCPRRVKSENKLKEKRKKLKVENNRLRVEVYTANR